VSAATPPVEGNTPIIHLPPTGERFLPGQMFGEIELEHLHRYAIARSIAHGKVVLDIASGEGYGSNLLAQVAAHVIGVDISPEAVAHAVARYRRGNLDFRQGDCSAIPVADHSIDLAVSFETLEHHDQHEEMLSELKRVLKPGGKLVISTPDKLEYSDRPGVVNPFHVKELYLEEIQRLLARHFQHQSLLAQRVCYGSLIVPKEKHDISFLTIGGKPEDIVEAPGLAHPMYWIALASDEKLPNQSVSLFDGTAAFVGLLRKNTLELKECREQLRQANERLDMVLNSYYWRMTFPIRWLRSLVRRLVGR